MEESMKRVKRSGWTAMYLGLCLGTCLNMGAQAQAHALEF